MILSFYPSQYNLNNNGTSNGFGFYSQPTTNAYSSPFHGSTLPERERYVRALAEEQAARSAYEAAVDRQRQLELLQRRERARQIALQRERERRQRIAQLEALRRQQQRQQQQELINALFGGVPTTSPQYIDKDDDAMMLDEAPSYQAFAPFARSRGHAPQCARRRSQFFVPEREGTDRRVRFATPERTQPQPQQQKQPQAQPHKQSPAGPDERAEMFANIFGQLLSEAMNRQESSSQQPAAQQATSASAAAGPSSTEKKASQTQLAAAAEKIQHAFREHVARKQSLVSIAELSNMLTALRDSFTFPTSLDFSPSSLIAGNPEKSAVSGPTLLYSPKNQPVHQYTESLLKLLQKLDAVESHGDAMVRQRRKEVVRTVEAELSKVDEAVKDIWVNEVTEKAEKLGEEVDAQAEAVEVEQVAENQDVEVEMSEEVPLADVEAPAATVESSTTETTPVDDTILSLAASIPVPETEVDISAASPSPVEEQTELSGENIFEQIAEANAPSAMDLDESVTPAEPAVEAPAVSETFDSDDTSNTVLNEIDTASTVSSSETPVVSDPVIEDVRENDMDVDTVTAEATVPIVEESEDAEADDGIQTEVELSQPLSAPEVTEDVDQKESTIPSHSSVDSESEAEAPSTTTPTVEEPLSLSFLATINNDAASSSSVDEEDETDGLHVEELVNDVLAVDDEPEPESEPENVQLDVDVEVLAEVDASETVIASDSEHGSQQDDFELL